VCSCVCVPTGCCTVAAALSCALVAPVDGVGRGFGASALPSGQGAKANQNTLSVYFTQITPPRLFVGEGRAIFARAPARPGGEERTNVCYVVCVCVCLLWLGVPVAFAPSLWTVTIVF
jgi:hypothetical protein